MRRLPWIAVGCGALAAAACTPPDAGDDGRNGRDEEVHEDPGVWQVAESLAGAYATPDGVATPETMRGALVWRDRDDGPWAYAERQRDGGAPQRRVYRVRYERPGYPADVFTLPAGTPPATWGGGAPLPDGLTPDGLTAHPACTIAFRRTGPGDYAGTTESPACRLGGDAGGRTAITVTFRDGDATVWERREGADSTVVAGDAAPVAFERVRTGRR